MEGAGSPPPERADTVLPGHRLSPRLPVIPYHTDVCPGVRRAPAPPAPLPARSLADLGGEGFQPPGAWTKAQVHLQTPGLPTLTATGSLLVAQASFRDRCGL